MIFQDLDFIRDLDVAQYAKHYGSAIKKPDSSKRHRSNMMLNPLQLTHLNRIDECQADVITLNLEDAIAPSRKAEVLHNIALFLSHLHSAKSKIVIRCNALNEGGAQEIEFLNEFGFDAIRLPKVKHPSEVEQALKLLSSDKELHISMETKEAYSNIASLKTDDRFTTANLGILDLLTSLGLPQNIVQLGNPTIEYILSKFLVDSLSVGIHPVSFMFQDYADTHTFEQWCELERSMGFGSKACMGPKQVTIANKIFGLTQAEVARAKNIKSLFESHSTRGVHGFMDENYGFVDEPIYRDALLVLENSQK